MRVRRIARRQVGVGGRRQLPLVEVGPPFRETVERQHAVRGVGELIGERTQGEQLRRDLAADAGVALAHPAALFDACLGLQRP